MSSLTRPQPIERTQTIGSRQQMVAVVTEANAPDNASPLVVILNSGIIHRVGPNRLSVQLARALAAQGQRVLRFDLSGIGDSEPRTDALTPLDGALADIREALEAAASQLGSQRFVLIGLCSGADHAVIYSGSDPRVVGLVLMDPTVPPTRHFHLRRIWGRLADPGLWRRLLRGDPTIWRRAIGAGVGQPADTIPARGPDLDQPEVRRFLEDAYCQALGESREMLAVFTDGLPSRHNYARQLQDAFPGVRFDKRVRLEYFHDADHIFSDEARRDRLIGLIAEWVRTTPFRV